MEVREGRCLRSPCRSRPCTRDRQLGFWERLCDCPTPLLLFIFFLEVSWCCRSPSSSSRWLVRRLRLRLYLTAIEEGQGSGNLNAEVSGYDLFVFPQFYVALFLFVSIALSYRFSSCVIYVSVYLFICFGSYILFGVVTESYIPCQTLMFDMLYGSCLHVVIMIHVMLIFINNIIYVIIILLIYGIKMIWKLSNILTLMVTSVGRLIQRLQVVPPPCRPLKQAAPVPCHCAGITTQARAWGHVMLGTGTEKAGMGHFRTRPNRHVPVSAQRAWTVWKTITAQLLGDGGSGLFKSQANLGSHADVLFCGAAGRSWCILRGRLWAYSYKEVR